MENGKQKITMTGEPEIRDGVTIITSIPTVPVTEQRQLFVPGPECELVEAGEYLFCPTGSLKLTSVGVSRANLAADQNHPDGTTEGDWNKEHEDETVVKPQHAALVGLTANFRFSNSTATSSTQITMESSGHSTLIEASIGSALVYRSLSLQCNSPSHCQQLFYSPPKGTSSMSLCPIPPHPTCFSPIPCSVCTLIASIAISMARIREATITKAASDHKLLRICSQNTQHNLTRRD